MGHIRSLPDVAGCGGRLCVVRHLIAQKITSSPIIMDLDLELVNLLLDKAVGDGYVATNAVCHMKFDVFLASKTRDGGTGRNNVVIRMWAKQHNPELHVRGEKRLRNSNNSRLDIILGMLDILTKIISAHGNVVLLKVAKRDIGYSFLIFVSRLTKSDLGASVSPGEARLPPWMLNLRQQRGG